MRVYFLFFLCFSSGALAAQETFTHFGGMRLHAGSNLGIHANLINLAPLEINKGKFGFYGEEPQEITGEYPLSVYDAEIASNYPVFFQIGLNIGHNLNLISGDLVTAPLSENIITAFKAESFVVGASDFSKIDGTVQAEIIEEFEFPVGDLNQLRPLKFKTSAGNAILRCTYFRTDPTASEAFGILNPLAKSRQLQTISQKEFWHLAGNGTGSVTISWNAESDLAAVSNSLENIEIIGWHTGKQSWQPIGITNRTGDLVSGSATSENFVPDDFQVLTFGGSRVPDKFYTLDNYYLSPNNDGVNDFLEIEELLDAPKNTLKIYNRNGILVFSRQNYVREFEGYSNTNNGVFQRNSGLPEGVYFYVAYLQESNTVFQGFLFLDR
ncbi:MAG: hypothetical protein RLZZ241_1636 [Bacteroidota bacterium]